MYILFRIAVLIGGLIILSSIVDAIDTKGKHGTLIAVYIFIGLVVYLLYKVFKDEPEPIKSRKNFVYQKANQVKVYPGGYYRLTGDDSVQGHITFYSDGSCRKSYITGKDIHANKKHLETYLATFSLPENKGRVMFDQIKNELQLVFAADTVKKQVYRCKLRTDGTMSANIFYFDEKGKARKDIVEYYFQNLG